MKQLVAFDLDGTLAESKQAIDPEMAALLARLTRIVRVAVISGGDWPQFAEQIVGNLSADADLHRLFLLPASGTKFYRYKTGWEEVYSQEFTADERKHILAALEESVLSAGLSGGRTWGDKIEDRGSQITFSGLGQHAPLADKSAWDPDFAKRKRLQGALIPLLAGFSVRVGGSTSVDITRAGIDKAYGMGKLAEITMIPPEAMIFIGDALYQGGNDYSVLEAGIDTIAVRDIHETKRIIETIALCLEVPAAPSA